MKNLETDTSWETMKLQKYILLNLDDHAATVIGKNSKIRELLRVFPV